MVKSSPKVLIRSEPKGLKPSRTLAKAGATLWAQITAEYDLSDSGGRELLLLACESLDRVESLRSQIDKQGEYVTDSKGNRRDNPLLRHELAGRAFISKALSRLGLALETPMRGVGRPPGPGLGVGPEYRRINGEHLMIKYIAVIRHGHNGRVIPVDGPDVRRVRAEEEANESKMIGEYSSADIARRHMLLALQRYSPLRDRKRA